LVGPRPAQVEVFSVATEVRFRALSEAEVVAYAATGEGMDKAGGYGIQGGAASFVAAIEGSYTNVVGLPLAETVEALEARRVPRRFSGGTGEPRGLG
ncbi:MAG TPA: Maf family protein, partial [Polyangiaceae bacterium LLY-WYZ-14_1]|nr:Maf family protein [Polyangiaceae bacterium LLY-WYZ-14_1]